MERDSRGPYTEGYVPSDRGSREWGDYIRVAEIATDTEPKIDIVFVHGLGDKWEQTWCNDDGLSWLKDMLPGELPPARVLVTGFNVLRRIDSDMQAFEDASEKLIEDLEEKRPAEKRPIVFIGHSLGGLVIQQALSRHSTPSLRESIKGIVFLATPHFGNDKLAWKGFWKKIARAVDDDEPQAASSSWLQEGLGRINTHFYDWLKSQSFRQHVFGFYEGLGVYRIGVIAPKPQLGKVFSPDDCELSVDHLNMARFDDLSDPNYQIVVKRIKSMYNYTEPSAESPDQVFQHFSQRNRTQTTSTTLTSDSQMSAPDAREHILESDKLSVNAKLALALEDQGHYKAAEDAYKEAIEEYKDSAGEDSVGEKHRLALYCMDKLASLLRDRSEYDEAAKLAQEVLNTRIETQGLENSATLSSAGNLAMIMRYQSKHQEAFSMLRNALENTEIKPLGSITRTRIVSVLAKIFRDHGSYDTAELLSRDVAYASSLWLGSDHPFTFNRQSDLSVACSTHATKERFLISEDISRMALDGLEKTLGRDHPNALRTGRRLGNFLRFQGEFRPALKRLETTLTRQKEQIGTHHPSTLSTMTGLAAVSILQGYVREGRASLEEAYKGQEVLLGPVHQNTIWTRTALEKLQDVPDEDEDEGVEDEDVGDFSSKLDPKLVEYLKSPSQITRHISLDPVPSLWHCTDSQETAIVHAMNNDDLGAVKVALKSATEPTVLGRALRVASYSGREEVVRLLLEHGAPINDRGGYYGTALQAAADAGCYSIVKLLLANGADVDAQGGLMNTALRAATFRGHEDIIKLLLANGANPSTRDVGATSTVLQVAVSRHDVSSVRALLGAKADPNDHDHIFGTALQEAAFIGDLEIVELLLEHGADPNIPGGLYGSAMQAALRASHKGVVTRLIEKGADASSYNMLHAILESPMDLVDVSFGRRVSDLFVMEPKFSERADTSNLRFGMRKGSRVVQEAKAGGKKKEEVRVRHASPKPSSPKPKSKGLEREGNREGKRDGSKGRKEKLKIWKRTGQV